MPPARPVKCVDQSGGVHWYPSRYLCAKQIGATQTSVRRHIKRHGHVKVVKWNNEIYFKPIDARRGEPISKSAFMCRIKSGATTEQEYQNICAKRARISRRRDTKIEVLGKEYQSPMDFWRHLNIRNKSCPSYETIRRWILFDKDIKQKMEEHNLSL